MEAILDSNFIISCFKEKVDFVSQLEENGFKILIPKEIIQELKDLRLNVPHADRVAIDMAFKILDSGKIKKTTLGSGKVDDKLIDKGKQGAYIATLDAYIKRNVPNRVVLNRAGKKIIIERT